MRNKRLLKRNLASLLLVLSVFLLPKSAFALECSDGEQVLWYAANAVNDTFSTADAACDAYDMSQIGRPTFYFVFSEEHINGGGYKCFHRSDTAQTPESPPLYAINAAISSLGCIPIIDKPPGKNDGCPRNRAGNPCDVATGNKYQSETDFNNKGLSFTRSYNSRNLADLGLGLGWRSNHQKKLIVSIDALIQVSGTGRGEPWTKVSDVWQGDDDSNVLIAEDASGFELTTANGDIEHYNLSGQILSATEPDGLQTTYQYNANDQLIQVDNHYGHSISFTYVAGNVATVTDAFGAIYTYEYDAKNNLAAVIYPDTTPNDSADNPRRIYHYENAGYPNNLTGVTDANGDRFSTYAYDIYGKAISTEHSLTSNAVGQERFELEYQTEATQ